MATNVGVAYVEIRPDLSGFASKLKTQVGRDMAAAGQQATQGLTRSLGSSSNALSSFTGELAGSAAMLKTGFAAAAGLAGSQLARFAMDAVEAASNVNEAISATGQIFGDASGQVTKFADVAATAAGLSKRAALEQADALGNLLITLGATQEEAAKTSVSLLRLAADMASRFNVAGGAEEMAQKFMSGLVGETEPLRRFGIIVDENTVKQKALALGLGGSNRELTEGEKVAARYALIMEKGGSSLGDYARTAKDLANAQRTAAAEMENAKAALGEGLIPVVTYGTVTLIGLIERLKDLANAAGDVGNIKVLGINVGTLAKKVLESQFPGFKLVEWIHGAGEEAVTASGSLGEVAKTIQLAGKNAIVTQQQIDTLKQSFFAEADAKRASESAARSVARADQDLADAKADLSKIEKQTAVDEEKVADARERLDEATRSLNHANRQLTKSQEDYNDAQAAFLALPSDENADKLRDAGYDLADATDGVADATARQKDAQKDLDKAKAGDPDYQDKLAAARRRVEDATQGVADAEYAQAKAAFNLQGATATANTALASNAETVGKIRSEWTELLKMNPAIEKFLAGPLALLAPQLGPAVPTTKLGSTYTPPPTPSAGVVSAIGSAVAGGTTAPAPAGPTPAYQLPAFGAPGQTAPVTINNIFNQQVDPNLVGKAIAWALD